MDLLDDSGEIKVTCFNNLVDRHFANIEQGKVYYITKAKIKTANKRFNKLPHDYELELKDDSTVELCVEGAEVVPGVQYNFVAIKDIEHVSYPT